MCFIGLREKLSAQAYLRFATRGDQSRIGCSNDCTVELIELTGRSIIAVFDAQESCIGASDVIRQRFCPNAARKLIGSFQNRKAKVSLLKQSYFRFWHLRDMPTGRDDVRFRVKAGSHGQTGKMTRLTQLRHRQALVN